MNTGFFFVNLHDDIIIKPYKEDELLEFILNAIPERDDHIFIKPLILFLKDPGFHLRLTLRNALLRMQKTLVLPELIEILKAGREVYPHSVRIEALKLMGELKLSYCMQSILENLPTLPLNEAKDFMKVFADYPKTEYYKKIEELTEDELSFPVDKHVLGILKQEI